MVLKKLDFGSISTGSSLDRFPLRRLKGVKESFVTSNRVAATRTGNPSG